MKRLVLATREQETFETAFARQGEAFSLGSVDVVSRPIHDHYVELVEQGGLSSGEVDLFLCCTDWLPEAIEKRLIDPIDGYLSGDPPEDWPGGWSEAMLGLQRSGGRVYGMPWHDGPEVFHTRTDLLSDPREKAAFLEEYGYGLEVPKTWDQFLDVAKFFTRPAEGLWGCCEGAYTDGHNNVYDFLIQLWSRGGVLLDDQFVPRFHEEVGVEALIWYRDLFHKHRVISPECLGMGSVEVGDFYAQGNAAMMWNWCGFAAVAEMPEFSKIVGKNQCSALPSGSGEGGESVSLNIYWVLTIPAASKNKDLAYAFMKHCSSREMDLVTTMSGANGVRLSTWQDGEVRRKYPYYSIIEQVHENTRTLPGIPEYPAINEAISDAVHGVIHEGADPALALGKAAMEAENILRSSGRIR